MKSVDINFFRKKGYLVVRNLLPQKKIHLVKKSINSVLIKLFDNQYPHLKRISFNKKLIYLRKKNPKSFSKLFDTLQTCSSLYNLVDEKFLKIIARLIRQNVSNITMTDIGLRLDPPHDTRNTLEWHQDSSYYRQNNLGKNGLVVWAPITKLDLNMGPLEFLENSFRIGTLKVKKKRSKLRFGSSKREINQKRLKKFNKILTSKLNVGDVLVMNLDMVHRSGKNTSNNVRISFLIRFHNMISNDFNPGLNLYKYSNKKLNFEIHGF